MATHFTPINPRPAGPQILGDPTAGARMSANTVVGNSTNTGNDTAINNTATSSLSFQHGQKRKREPDTTPSDNDQANKKKKNRENTSCTACNKAKQSCSNKGRLLASCTRCDSKDTTCEFNDPDPTGEDFRAARTLQRTELAYKIMTDPSINYRIRDEYIMLCKESRSHKLIKPGFEAELDKLIWFLDNDRLPLPRNGKPPTPPSSETSPEAPHSSDSSTPTDDSTADDSINRLRKRARDVFDMM